MCWVPWLPWRRWAMYTELPSHPCKIMVNVFEALTAAVSGPTHILSILPIWFWPEVILRYLPIMDKVVAGINYQHQQTLQEEGALEECKSRYTAARYDSNHSREFDKAVSFDRPGGILSMLRT